MSITAVLLPGLLAVAQTEPPPDPRASTEAIEFASRDDRMTLPVTIAGAGPFPFIVDTGAQRSVISRELAATLGLPAGRVVRMVAMTGASSVPTVIIPRITVGSLGGEAIEAPALAASHLGGAGLLGLDTLQDRMLTIDFDTHTMTVAASRERRRAPRAAASEILVYAKSVLGQLVVTEASYRGIKVRVVLDTGSSASVGNLALQRRVGRRQRSPVTLMSVTGAMLAADQATLSELNVGGVGFADLPVAFADAAPFSRFNLRKRPALLLGMDALRLFRRVEIDFANRTVRFALPRGMRR